MQDIKFTFIYLYLLNKYMVPLGFISYFKIFFKFNIHAANRFFRLLNLIIKQYIIPLAFQSADDGYYFWSGCPTDDPQKSSDYIRIRIRGRRTLTTSYLRFASADPNSTELWIWSCKSGYLKRSGGWPRLSHRTIQ